jgi:hypothetical protein
MSVFKTSFLPHFEFSTRTPHTFTFDANRRGKIIYPRKRKDNRKDA